MKLDFEGNDRLADLWQQAHRVAEEREPADGPVSDEYLMALAVSAYCREDPAWQAELLFDELEREA